MTTLFTFKDFPFPPSENQIYRNIMYRTKNQRAIVGRAKTAQYRDFEAKVQMWSYSRTLQLNLARHQIKEDYRLWIDFKLLMPYAKLYSKRGTIKRWDVTNRIKAMLDLFSKCLGIDDSQFFKCTIEKIHSTFEDVEITVGHLKS